MQPRRTVLRWAIGFAACLAIDAESIMRGLQEDVYAKEPIQPAKEITLEAWMNEWMSVLKAPGGMLKVSRFREPIYFLLDSISWTPNPGQEAYPAVTVPTGFVSDFASIPPAFYSLLRPDGEYAYAAVVHDYLYWTQTLSREEADQILKLAMEDFEIGTLTLNTIYNAVRLGGEGAWNSNAINKANGEKRILKRFPQDPRTSWEDWKKRAGVFEP
jgi:hypothetical protein